MGSAWVGPGKPNLPLGLRGKAGGCARVTAGPKRPHLGVRPGAASYLENSWVVAWQKASFGLCIPHHCYPERSPTLTVGSMAHISQGPRTGHACRAESVQDQCTASHGPSHPMPSLVSDWYHGVLSGLSQTMPVKGDSPWQWDHSSRVSPWPLACPYWQHCTEGRALGHSEERTL